MDKKNQQVRTRIPPSPTGFMHIGTARTALFNFLFARHNNGEFLFRIEDTDTERSKPEFIEDIIESLKWLGLNWDGKILKQSERKNIYAKHIKQLLDSNKAFWCFHTKEELEEEKQKKAKRGEPQVHSCEHKELVQGQTPDSSVSVRGLTLDTKQAVIRLKCANKKIVFNDLIRDEIEFSPSQIGDIVIAKDEQTPLYNFAVVIDDYESKITHVIRGEDHISNTPKQIMILEALDLPLPQYAHMTLTLAPDKTKLSKRHGATSIKEYKEMGYLPEAMINFMAMLGWNPGTEREFFSLKELTQEFSIERMQKSAAIFNVEKLNWFNAHYIKQKSIEELTELCLPHLEDLVKKHDTKYLILNTNEIVERKYLEKIIGLQKERIKKLSEIGELSKFFFQEPEYDPALLCWKKMEKDELKLSLDNSYNILHKIQNKAFSEEFLKELLMKEAEKTGDRGKLLWPLRVALTGLKASPPPFEVLAVLGRDKALKRLKRAINML